MSDVEAFRDYLARNAEERRTWAEKFNGRAALGAEFYGAWTEAVFLQQMFDLYVPKGATRATLGFEP